jgi:hypothetical protein
MKIGCIFLLNAPSGAFGKKAIMCDYSLFEFPNRLAREGEELVTYRFPSGSIGLASPVELENARSRDRAQDKPSRNGILEEVTNHFELSRYRLRARPSVCAICLPPGTHLMLKDIPATMQQDFGLCPEESGTFIETGIEAHRHRDAVQFANGRVILLQRLCEGQRIQVLSLVPAGEFVDEGRSALVG